MLLRLLDIDGARGPSHESPEVLPDRGSVIDAPSLEEPFECQRICNVAIGDELTNGSVNLAVQRFEEVVRLEKCYLGKGPIVDEESPEQCLLELQIVGRQLQFPCRCLFLLKVPLCQWNRPISQDTFGSREGEAGRLVPDKSHKG